MKYNKTIFYGLKSLISIVMHIYFDLINCPFIIIPDLNNLKFTRYVNKLLIKS